MKRHFILAALLMPVAAAAQDTTATQITWGGFVDAYYSYNFNLDGPADQPILTQPARHNEFNVNLAHVSVSASADRLRGRLALQVGTAVHANYAGEPAFGVNSGPTLARHIQEATAGYRVSDDLWIDAGIFFSHIGGESWVSRDNWTYTRSLVAELSPYYESGAKATWSPGNKLTGTLALVNGWQNISENNAGKAGGIRLDYAATPKLTLTYSNFLGNEAPDSVADSRVRFFHDFGARITPSEQVGFLLVFDVGNQSHTVGDESATWWGFSAIGHWQVSSTVALTGRFERYDDPDGVITSGLETNGFSANLDVAPAPRFLWRMEFRNLIADDPIFPNSDGDLKRSNPFVVSSFAFTF